MEEADIVVIGCGSGGSAAAGRLSEDGRYTVAVLEAGRHNRGLKTVIPGMLPFQGRETNWAFETVPQRGLSGRRGYQPRGRGMGGSSAINAMLYVRGHPGDYDEWRRLGCTGWGWDDVLPWFCHAERNERGADAFHGDDGPVWVRDQDHVHPGSRAFVEAAEEAGLPFNFDFNGSRQLGAGLFQVTQRGGERWSAARAYLSDAKRRPNLDIIVEATVERVLFEGGRVWGVAYMHDGQPREIRARRAVVLAAGAFQTPQLLMLSGIGPAQHLREFGLAVRSNRPGVGADLQDHIDYAAAFETRGNLFPGRSAMGSAKSLAALGRWLVTRRGAMTSPYAEAGAFLRTRLSDERPDVQLHFVIAMIEDHGREKLSGHGFSCHAAVLRPESRGSVRLQSLDPHAAPLIDPAYLTAPRDLEVLKAGVRAMYRVLEAPAMARFEGRDRWPVDLADDAALERLIRARADTIYHPVGTARMGSDDAAVTTPRLKVRGVDGLYIADASVMPRIVGGNTNAAAMMIGERCAAFVREDLG